MSLHPLLQRLVELHGAALLTPRSVDEFAARPGAHALLFHGDPVRFPEALDVAVVLPELRRATGGAFDIGIVAREHEDVLARRYAVQRWPSLVFLRGSGYLATVSGMQDWREYLAAVQSALDGPVARVPGVGIPVLAADAAASACR
jgi:hydrogenase-1 operon protein HyaE